MPWCQLLVNMPPEIRPGQYIAHVNGRANSSPFTWQAPNTVVYPNYRYALQSANDFIYFSAWDELISRTQSNIRNWTYILAR